MNFKNCELCKNSIDFHPRNILLIETFYSILVTLFELTKVIEWNWNVWLYNYHLLVVYQKCVKQKKQLKFIPLWVLLQCVLIQFIFSWQMLFIKSTFNFESTFLWWIRKVERMKEKQSNYRKSKFETLI